MSVSSLLGSRRYGREVGNYLRIYDAYHSRRPKISRVFQECLDFPQNVWLKLSVTDLLFMSSMTDSFEKFCILNSLLLLGVVSKPIIDYCLLGTRVSVYRLSHSLLKISQYITFDILTDMTTKNSIA